MGIFNRSRPEPTSDQVISNDPSGPLPASNTSLSMQPDEQHALLDKMADAIRQNEAPDYYELWLEKLISSGMALDDIETEIRKRIDFSEQWARTRRRMRPLAIGFGLLALLVVVAIPWLISTLVANQTLARATGTAPVVSPTTILTPSQVPQATTASPSSVTPAPQGHWKIDVVYYGAGESTQPDTRAIPVDVLVQNQDGTPAPDGLLLTLGVTSEEASVQPSSPRTRDGIAHAIVLASTAITETKLWVSCDNDGRKVTIPLGSPPAVTFTPTEEPTVSIIVSLVITPSTIDIGIDESVPITVQVMTESKEPVSDREVKLEMNRAGLVDVTPSEATTDAKGTIPNVVIKAKAVGDGNLVASLGASPSVIATAQVTVRPVGIANKNLVNLWKRPTAGSEKIELAPKGSRLVIVGQNTNEEGKWYLVRTPKGNTLFVYNINVDIKGSTAGVKDVGANAATVMPTPTSTRTSTPTDTPTWTAPPQKTDTPVPPTNTPAPPTSTPAPTPTDTATVTPQATDAPPPTQYEIKEETHLYAVAGDVGSEDKTKTVIYRLPVGFKKIYPTGPPSDNRVPVKIIVWTTGYLAVNPDRFVKTIDGVQIRIEQYREPPADGREAQSLQAKASDYPVTKIEGTIITKIEVKGWMDLSKLEPVND